MKTGFSYHPITKSSHKQLKHKFVLFRLDLPVNLTYSKHNNVSRTQKFNIQYLSFLRIDLLVNVILAAGLHLAGTCGVHKRTVKIGRSCFAVRSEVTSSDKAVLRLYSSARQNPILSHQGLISLSYCQAVWDQLNMLASNRCLP